MDGALTVYCKQKSQRKKTALAFTRKGVESNTENKTVPL